LLTQLQKTTIDIVLVDIWKDTKKPLMVYATEDALGTPKDHLSSQLERFIKVENKAFRQELSKEESTANESNRRETLSPARLFRLIRPSRLLRESIGLIAVVQWTVIAPQSAVTMIGTDLTTLSSLMTTKELVLK